MKPSIVGSPGGLKSGAPSGGFALSDGEAHPVDRIKYNPETKSSADFNLRGFSYNGRELGTLRQSAQPFQRWTTGCALNASL